MFRSCKDTCQGIIYIGEELPDTEQIIRKRTGVATIARFPWLPAITTESILELSKNINFPNQQRRSCSPELS